MTYLIKTQRLGRSPNLILNCTGRGQSLSYFCDAKGFVK